MLQHFIVHSAPPQQLQLQLQLLQEQQHLWLWLGNGTSHGTSCCCTTFDHLLHITASNHTSMLVCISPIHTFYYWLHLSTIHAICILSCSKWHYVVVNYNQLPFAKRIKTLCWMYTYCGTRKRRWRYSCSLRHTYNHIGKFPQQMHTSAIFLRLCWIG